MKKKRKLLYITGFTLAAIFISILLFYDHVHFNHSKDDIFEIPNTYKLRESGKSMRYEKYYFIQHSPNSEQELDTTIESFITQNMILEDAKNNDAEYVALNFMIPDYNLPIYFEDNKSYFKMDDYITNCYSSPILSSKSDCILSFYHHYEHFFALVYPITAQIPQKVMNKI